MKNASVGHLHKVFPQIIAMRLHSKAAKWQYVAIKKYFIIEKMQNIVCYVKQHFFYEWLIIFINDMIIFLNKIAYVA